MSGNNSLGPVQNASADKAAGKAQVKAPGQGLTVQKASAGSGKTFKLTRTYLTDFLTKRQGERHILRNKQELEGSASHILAVTFTNKATEEMKTRIVRCLAALAAASPGLPDDKQPDYLAYLHRLTGRPEEEVIATCKLALKALLYHFSDFNVSTIDAFFQTILRTFAYEAELNDTYQLEIDNERLARQGVDDMLENACRKPNSITTPLIERLMKKDAGSGKIDDPWRRRLPTKNYHDNIYSIMIKNISKMDSEAFMEQMKGLEEYFNRPGFNFEAHFKSLHNSFEGKRASLWKSVREAAAEIEDAFAGAGLDIKEDGVRGSTGLCAHIRRSKIKNVQKPDEIKPDSFKNILSGQGKKKMKEPTASMQAAFDKWADAVALWKGYEQGKDYRLWNVYSELLALMPGMLKIRNDIREANADNNVVPLSDTNTMLRGIIGDNTEVVPFIYERVGSRVRHYLIDEFQDTSKMQWQNFEPLIRESLGYAHDNLIIGDPKQSIYRWRNADFTILTDTIPATFSGYEDLGALPADNTNWRSLRRIVTFNNSFFSWLAGKTGGPQGNPYVAPIYSAVEQSISKKEDNGYVEVNIVQSSTTGDDKKIPEYLYGIASLVDTLRRRGYPLSQIGIISRTNQQNNWVVDVLEKYNKEHPGEGISFVSDESLMLVNSRAVRTVIAVFRDIANGNHLETPAASADSRVPLSSVANRAIHLRAGAPDRPTHEIVSEALRANDVLNNQLQSMVSSMKSEALPALTEAIIGTFIGDALKEEDAPYLAALQDTVLAYCENNSADIPSFLEWWETAGAKLAISSPAESDAVRIMTCHKSKGLEFDCVILPFTEESFAPRSGDWIWVPTDADFRSKHDIPAFLPVILDKERLQGTPYAGKWEEHRHLTMLDNMNLDYVAFTRAAKELYIYAKLDKNTINKFSCVAPDSLIEAKKQEMPRISNLQSISAYLYEYCALIHNGELPSETPMRASLDPLPVFRFGTPLSDAEIERYREKDRKKKESEKSVARQESEQGYAVSMGDSNINCRFSDISDKVYANADERRAGTVRHAVMQGIKVEADISRSVRRQVCRGNIDPLRREEFEQEIAEALRFQREQGYDWFSPALTVICEREIITPSRRRGSEPEGRRDSQADEERYRADRIVVDAEGHATVIDYKFGEEKDLGDEKKAAIRKKYRRQVKGYVDSLLASGQFSSVEGYIWYVPQKEICKV